MPTIEEIRARNALLDALKNDSLTKDDALELKRILESEKTQATQIGDVVLIFGISLLLALVIDYISKQKFNLRNIFGSKKRRTR
jgi:hypothetical protein